MRKRVAWGAVVWLLVAVVLWPAAVQAQKITTYTLPGENIYPEGIAYQAGTGHFFVGSTADGTIYRGDLASPQLEVFLPGGQDGRTSATGMKVDGDGRLYVAGGATGRFFIYDLASKALVAGFDLGPDHFLNDMVVTKDGPVYVTDSYMPVLYRVSPTPAGFTLEEFMDFSQPGSPLQYGPGFNLNGIVATVDGQFLITAQSNTGKLFAINAAARRMIEINLGGTTLPGADGLLFDGRNLYLIQNEAGRLVQVHLAGNLTSGQVISSYSGPEFAFPTTLAEAAGRLLVVNLQFNRPTPVLPFTVVSVKKP